MDDCVVDLHSRHDSDHVAEGRGRESWLYSVYQQALSKYEVTWSTFVGLYLESLLAVDSSSTVLVRVV